MEVIMRRYRNSLVVMSLGLLSGIIMAFTAGTMTDYAISELFLFTYAGGMDYVSASSFIGMILPMIALLGYCSNHFRMQLDQMGMCIFIRNEHRVKWTLKSLAQICALCFLYACVMAAGFVAYLLFTGNRPVGFTFYSAKPGILCLILTATQYSLWLLLGNMFTLFREKWGGYSAVALYLFCCVMRMAFAQKPSLLMALLNPTYHGQLVLYAENDVRHLQTLFQRALIEGLTLISSAVYLCVAIGVTAILIVKRVNGYEFIAAEE